MVNSRRLSVATQAAIASAVVNVLWLSLAALIFYFVAERLPSIAEQWLCVFLGVVGTTLCSLAVYGLVQARLGGLVLLASALERLGRGELSEASQEILNTEKPDDELAGLLHEAQRVSEQIRALIEQLRRPVDEMSRAVSGITVSANQAASATEGQGIAAATMTGLIGSLTSAVRRLEQQARAASQSADSAAERSSSGSRAMENIVVEVERTADSVAHCTSIVTALSERSASIASMLRGIGEIAEQTSLLALNAAIESARAGEQGRGFAVVADEVRHLAERTAESTSEIARVFQSLLGETEAAVSAMNELAGRVDVQKGQTVNAVDDLLGAADAVRDAAERVRAIGEDAREQGSVAQRVAEQVQTLTNISGQQSAAASEATRGADDLTRLAFDLQHTIERFKVT